MRGALAGVVWCLVLVTGSHASATVQSDVVALDDGLEPGQMTKDEANINVEGNQMKGVPWNSVGYPKQKRLTGKAAERLQTETPGKTGDTSHLADKRIYPNSHQSPTGGTMTAEDVRSLMSDMDPYIENIQAAKIKEQKFQDYEDKMRAFGMKALADKIGAGPQGVELLTGAIGHQLGMLNGNLGNCQKKLAKCKSEKQELGEGQSPEQIDAESPKTTATEDDMAKRGQEHPAAEIKAKPAGEGETKTASEDYVAWQTGAFWKKLPYEPGFKMTYDRLTQDQLKRLTQATRAAIMKSKRLEKSEMAESYKQISDANKKALSALMDAASSKKTMDKTLEVKTTEAVVEKMATTQNELTKCTEELKQECKITMRLAEPAASTGMTPGSLNSWATALPHPDDAPDRDGAGQDKGPEKGVKLSAHDQQTTSVSPNP